MATITNKQVTIFREVGALFVRHYHNKTKLLFAVQKMLKRTEKLQEAYVDEQNDKRIQLAAVDGDKNLIMKNDRYSYTPANQRELNKALRDLSNTKVDIGNPHFVDDIPADLTFQYPIGAGQTADVSDYDVRFAFAGIVIKEEEEEEE